ncbi:Uncharacterised protein [Citrobacter werkmanii]|uniref:Uncharacterized protein n=1 Tax=Citrobacter werkmanii TaxID=67827 RepID=A0A9N8CZZ2_9ENTR|nr:Uncharacterised protein [Citrobacter werkmanii]
MNYVIFDHSYFTFLHLKLLSNNFFKHWRGGAEFMLVLCVLKHQVQLINH